MLNNVLTGGFLNVSSHMCLHCCIETLFSSSFQKDVRKQKTVVMTTLADILPLPAAWRPSEVIIQKINIGACGQERA